MLGTIGQLLLLVAFLASALSGAAYFMAARRGSTPGWQAMARASWGVVTLTAIGAFALLAYLLFTHQYQYAYVYQNVSNDLPWYFLLAASWQSQAGSFLLWIAYTSLMGLALMKWSPRAYEAPVMAVVAACQFFLLSMVMGLPLGGWTIGASPFAGLAEAFPNAPIFQANPGYVPADGQGLNELLKSYWMAIHPPTLFLGFAAMTVPFAFAVAALWKRRYTQWVRLALPWTLFATVVLGVGIAMGGYWAYETLSFGGYWAWDPVENASLVPWIIAVAALHAMLIQKKSGRGHKAALILSILAYMFVVYESFLTRSGILADISVHSFVDLGLYNQLLIWMAVIALAGFGLFAWRYRELPTPERESHTLSREFLMFCGVILLSAIALVVIVGTSAPILGWIFRNQPSAVPVAFYNNWTLPLALGVTFLAGLGQLFWWSKMSIEKINRALIRPLGLAVASTVVVLLFTPFVQATVHPVAAEAGRRMAEASLLGGVEQFWSAYGQGLLLLLLVFAGFFALYGNGWVLWRVARGNPKMAGGALSHVGFALMILGIVASSGLSDALSTRGLGGEVRDYFVLTPGEPRRIEGYRMRYVGTERTAEGRTAYLIDVKGPEGRSFRLKPVAYQTEGQWFQHPDIKHFFATDLYMAVSPRAMQVSLENDDTVEGNAGAGKGGELSLARGDSTVIGGGAFAVEFAGFDTRVDPELLPDSTDIAVAARLDVTNLQTGETRRLRPVYLIMQDRSQQYLQNRVPGWDLTVTFAGMNVDSETAQLVVEGVEISPEEWIVVSASVKPFINVFWVGVLVLFGGFIVSLVRRIQDARFSIRRGHL